MGSFFTKLASVDPIAQALDLPGAHKQAQAQAQDAAGQTDTNGGAYTGINPTLAGANAGYAPGGPGATVGFAPTQPTPGNSLMNFFQKTANFAGNNPGALGMVSPYNKATTGGGFVPNFSTGNQAVPTSQTQNPYVTAARGATQQNQWAG